MDKIKNIMHKNAQKGKEEFNKNMDNIQSAIDSSNSISELYFLVANMYSHRLGDKELGVSVLQEGLTGEFFTKETKGKHILNGVIFENEDYSVLFSNNQSRYIKIEDKNPIRKHLTHDMRTKENLIVANRRDKAIIPHIGVYLQNPNILNRKKLISKLRKLTTYTNGNLTDYTIVKDIDWHEELESIKKNIKATEDRIAEIELRPKEFKTRQLEYVSFINSLSDLTQFSKNGWHITSNLDEDYHDRVTLFNN